MKVPLILITYGFSQKLFSYEDEGVHRLPIFSEAILASIFLKSVIEKMAEFLEDQDKLEVQVCSKLEHAVDVFKLVGVLSPDTTIIYNAAPMVEDPQAEIAKIAKQLNSQTTINREYALDDWLELLEAQLSESSS